MSVIPKKYITATRPARDKYGQIIPGICVICGDKSKKDKMSHICDDTSRICWERAIRKGYIVPCKSYS